MSLERFKPYRIILASKSPRRSALLRELGLSIVIDMEDGVDEQFPPQLKAGEIAEFLAVMKSEAYSKPLLAEDILITADTIVWQGDHILGKPKDERDAHSILQKLSGNTHQVFTGVCLRSSSRKYSFVSETRVGFAELSKEEINYYVSQYKPFDKAGAYGIQEWIGYIAVEEIHGSYFNVMGLPVQRLYKELLKFIK